MKKLTTLCLCFLLLLVLVGCSAQPAETSAPESSEVQTETPAETQTEAITPSSSADESSSETVTAETASIDTSEAEPSVPEESADDSTAEESDDSSAPASSAESSSTETSSENSAAESSADAETSAEPSSSESTETLPETTEEATDEFIIAETFRFMLPADWEKQNDGSLAAADGSVRISFRTVPLNDTVFSEGIKIKDDDFGKQLVAWFNESGDSEITYTIYDSSAADQVCRTENGLDYRFILIMPDGDSTAKDSSILSAYSLDKENVLVIRFEYGLEAGISAEECLETVNKTIERIKQ